MLKFLKDLHDLPPVKPSLFSEEVAAKALNLSISTMQRLRKNKKIPFIQLGAQVRYTPEIIAEIIEVLKVPACPKTASKSEPSGSPNKVTPQSGVQPGSMQTLDKHVVHHLALKTFKKPK